MAANPTNPPTWADERVGWRGIWQYVLHRKIPRTNWAYTLGSATLFAAIIQIVTGMILAIYYVPSTEQAWASVNYIQNEVLFGSFIRGLHHYGASAMVILVGLHMVRVVIYGAYKYPREVTWLSGVVLLVITLGFSFTGYLLPWDQKAYWATVVGTEFAGAVPFIGEPLLQIVRGGPDVTAVTLTRFFSLHVLWLPAALGLFMLVHLYLVIRLGISAPPRLETDPPPPLESEAE